MRTPTIFTVAYFVLQFMITLVSLEVINDYGGLSISLTLILAVLHLTTS